MRRRTARLYAVGTAGVLVMASAAIASVGLGRHADLFYTPQLLQERGMPEDGKRIRIGGYVDNGSLKYGQGAEIKFDVVDGSNQRVSVSFTGIAPDLFREGQGVVATGRFASGARVFLAEQILAKHDENYQPRELEGVSAPGEWTG